MTPLDGYCWSNTRRWQWLNSMGRLHVMMIKLTSSITLSIASQDIQGRVSDPLPGSLLLLTEDHSRLPPLLMEFADNKKR